MHVCVLTDRNLHEEDLTTFQGQSADTIAVNNFLEDNILIRQCQSDPHILLGPPSIIQAQDVDPTHVADLVASFLGTGTISKHGIGVVLDTEMHTRWKDNQEEITQEDCENAGICMISGNHTAKDACISTTSFLAIPPSKCRPTTFA